MQMLISFPSFMMKWGQLFERQEMFKSRRKNSWYICSNLYKYII